MQAVLDTRLFFIHKSSDIFFQTELINKFPSTLYSQLLVNTAQCNTQLCKTADLLELPRIYSFKGKGTLLLLVFYESAFHTLL